MILQPGKSRILYVMFSGAKNEVSEIEDCRAEIPKQSSFPLSEITVSLRRFCEFIRTENFYVKSLAKWAELYYNITVLFFGIELHL